MNLPYTSQSLIKTAVAALLHQLLKPCHKCLIIARVVHCNPPDLVQYQYIKMSSRHWNYLRSNLNTVQYIHKHSSQTLSIMVASYVIESNEIRT